jgi:D-alanyl-D-alanine carboxypeptidase
LLLATLLLVSACVGSPSEPRSAASPSSPDSATSGAKPATAGPAAAPSFDKHTYSTTRASSIWVIVNKHHPLDPIRYRPRLSVVEGRQVDRRMAPYLTQLLAAAKRAGNPLHVVSGYRSYGYQQSVFGSLAAEQGKGSAEMWSAKPGYSEHQTGLAADLDLANRSTCSLQSCFGSTHGGRWLAANAWRYGFIVRYTKANTAITGYEPEPWHIRYVGKPLARELHAVHATSLEGYFGVSGGK